LTALEANMSVHSNLFIKIAFKVPGIAYRFPKLTKMYDENISNYSLYGFLVSYNPKYIKFLGFIFWKNYVDQMTFNWVIFQTGFF
jgi:hypothetical protein